MFQIYRNLLPQVINSIPLSANQPQYYRPSTPYQYGLGGMSNMVGMSNMAGLGAMGGMSSLANISASNLNSPNLSGMPSNNLGAINNSLNMNYANKFT